MNGIINFDVNNDMDVLEMCRFINEHQHLTIETNYNGRYVEVKFSADTSSKKEAES